MTLVKIFKVEALGNFTPPCAKPPRLTVLGLEKKNSGLGPGFEIFEAKIKGDATKNVLIIVS